MADPKSEKLPDAKVHCGFNTQDVIPVFFKEWEEPCQNTIVTSQTLAKEGRTLEWKKDSQPQIFFSRPGCCQLCFNDHQRNLRPCMACVCKLPIKEAIDVKNLVRCSNLISSLVISTLSVPVHDAWVPDLVRLKFPWDHVREKQLRQRILKDGCVGFVHFEGAFATFMANAEDTIAFACQVVPLQKKKIFGERERENFAFLRGLQFGGDPIQEDNDVTGLTPFWPQRNFINKMFLLHS